MTSPPTILHFRAHWSRAKLESELDFWIERASTTAAALAEMHARLQKTETELATYRELLGAEIDGFEVEVRPPKANVVPFRREGT